MVEQKQKGPELVNQIKVQYISNWSFWYEYTSEVILLQTIYERAYGGEM